ncbi:protein DnaJ [Seminavis robusta]|uniref:Protein DnaJ n=1 Tax=Seminavis robusta TaxID=568900 RepID=A0A9N8E565_9STRA|nr:protein DnaJ [Seminavis robusta]|eukprot:Sro628_g178130.1 protein DnaJ (362) ;mRNA; r:51195-52280
MQKGDDPYEILGVSEEAEKSEIRKAYRKLAVQHHPDKQSTEEGREKAHHIFARIACAYELLSDDEKRKEYDEQQAEAEAEHEGDDDDDDEWEKPGFDGNATYDYPFDPSRNAGSTALVVATEKTGKSWFGKKNKKKKKKPMHFSDPYEVFKRAFKDEFGYEYPGAKWDNIELTGKDIHHRGKNAPLALENGGVGDNAPPEEKEKKKKGGILTLFKRKKEDQQLTVHKGDKGGGGGGGDGAVANNKPPPGNNRPSSMETKTHKIEHDDGTVETITETIITRPDGSQEKMRQTDMPEKGTHNWTKPNENAGGGKKDQKMLTSGKEGQKLLTNGGGDDKKKAAKKKEPKKKITNGEKKKAITNG